MTRPLLFLVNDLASFKPDQSTAVLARRCAERYPRVALCGVRGLALREDGRVRARALVVSPDGLTETEDAIDLGGAAVWVRLNPGRNPWPWATAYALEALVLAQRRGAIVLNSPGGLWPAGSKLSVLALPESVRPATFVSPDPARVVAWIRARGNGAVVIKPALGTHGDGVQKVAPDAADLEARVAALAKLGPVVVQPYLARAPEGDVRIHLVDGKPLTAGGKPCVVRRLPPPGDFRSNVHAGGAAAAATWNDELALVARRCAPVLRSLGLFHVGLDTVGGKVVEVNAFSPGGLAEAGAFAGVDFVEALIDAFAAKVLALGQRGR